MKVSTHSKRKRDWASVDLPTWSVSVFPADDFHGVHSPPSIILRLRGSVTLSLQGDDQDVLDTWDRLRAHYDGDVRPTIDEVAEAVRVGRAALVAEVVA